MCQQYYAVNIHSQNRIPRDRILPSKRNCFQRKQTHLDETISTYLLATRLFVQKPLDSLHKGSKMRKLCSSHDVI